MALGVNGILFDELSADPGSPVEGQVWFNSTTFQLKLYRNGSTQVIIDQVAFDAHALSTANPHDTTLEQARSENNTVAGVINMGGNAINNLGAGSLGTDAAQRGWVSDQIQQRITGLDWQNSVLSQINTPPGSPVTGDRYIVTAVATGAWVGQENNIAEWDGSAWDFTVPNEGFTLEVENVNIVFTYTGAAWVQFGNVVSHSALLNLLNDDHPQYLLVDGTRAMSGDLDMGTNDVTNAGTYNGVTVQAHASRHNPGGADALATAAATGLSATTTNTEGTAASFARSDHTHAIDVTNGAITTVEAGDVADPGTGTGLARRDHQHAVSTGTVVTISDSTNSEGVGTPLARADHVHAHGTRGGGTLHAATTLTAAGFQPQSNRTAILNPTVTDDGAAGYLVGSYWINTVNDTVWFCTDASTGAAVWQQVTNSGAALATKAGSVLAASFAGNPKTVTVTFGAAFADANYSVTVTAVTTSNKSFALSVETQLAASFVINAGSNNVTNLTQVNWTAVKHGETA